MQKIKAKLIKLLSGITLAAFLLGGVPVYAQSNEGEEKDTEGPIINSSIMNGRLRVEAYDESGVDAIYVNNYEFTKVNDGVLSIRLEQFDSDYEEFSLKAVDLLGNESFTYKIKNPYYEKEREEDEIIPLPEDASASTTDEALAWISSEETNEQGTQFYTFETANGKTFYLIVEEDDTVHFLSSVTENDLFNTLLEVGTTLPKNSAAMDSNVEIEIRKVTDDGKTTEVSEKESKKETKAETKTSDIKKSFEMPQISKSTLAYIGMGLAVLITALVCWYVKVYKKKQPDFKDEDDDYDDPVVDENSFWNRKDDK